jgi:hypothetical protein
MQAQFAPQFAGFLERYSADDVERYWRPSQRRNNISGKLVFEPFDVIFYCHLINSIYSRKEEEKYE